MFFQTFFIVLPQESGLDAAIEELLKLENQMRRSADVSRTRRVVMAIVQLCYEARAWKTLNDQIHILSQRQPQLPQVTNVCEGSFLSSSVIIYAASHNSACCLRIFCLVRYFLLQAKESSIQKKNHIACRRKWKSEGIGDFENHIFCMWLLLFPPITIGGIRACK